MASRAAWRTCICQSRSSVSLPAISSRRALSTISQRQSIAPATASTTTTSQRSAHTSTTTASISASTKPQDGPSTTHFGFETISAAEKEGRVGAVFSSVASTYDVMNDLMSLGIHRLWKDHFVRSLNPGSKLKTKENEDRTLATEDSQRGWHILDVAGGTGDIAFRMLDHATDINGDNYTKVTVADINADMLREGQKRSLETPYASSSRLRFVEANAEKLDMIPDNSVDLYTVAFGIRNFTNKDIALREAYRVLKPGGVFACLEFSKVTSGVFDQVYKRWSFSAIPMIGQLVAGDRDSYQYLVESIEKFPDQQEWRQMIKDAGFVVGEGLNGEEGGFENLSMGIAAIHKGIKPRIT